MDSPASSSRFSPPGAEHLPSRESFQATVSLHQSQSQKVSSSHNRRDVSPLSHPQIHMPGQRGTETSEQTFKPLGAREKKESIPFDDSDNQISELFSLINITSDPNHKDGNLLKPVAVYTRQHSAPEKVGGNCKDISESNPIHQDRVVSKTRKRQRLEMPEDTSQKFASFPKRHHLRPEMSYTATRDMRFIFTPQAPVTHSPQQMDSLPFDMKFFEERDMGSDRRNAEKTQLPEGKP